MAGAPSRRSGARRPTRDDDDAPAPVRDPGPTFLVIGCRLLSTILLIVALAVGQWASVLTSVGDAGKGGAEVRVVFGLTEATAGLASAGSLATIDTQPYSSARFQGEAASAAGTSKMLGLAVAAALIASILLAGASLGHTGAMPGLGRCAGFAWLANALTVLLGLWFMKSGLVGEARAAVDTLMRVKISVPKEIAALVPNTAFTARTSGGFSFYVSILALIFLAIAWSRAQVANVDEKRRQRARRGTARR